MALNLCCWCVSLLNYLNDRCVPSCSAQHLDTQYHTHKSGVKSEKWKVISKILFSTILLHVLKNESAIVHQITLFLFGANCHGMNFLILILKVHLTDSCIILLSLILHQKFSSCTSISLPIKILGLPLVQLMDLVNSLWIFNLKNNVCFQGYWFQ